MFIQKIVIPANKLGVFTPSTFEENEFTQIVW